MRKPRHPAAASSLAHRPTPHTAQARFPSLPTLHAPPNLEALRAHLASWRNQGLIHVLSVAAHNMQEVADWLPGHTLDPVERKDLESFGHCLTAFNERPLDYALTIRLFIDSQDPSAQTSRNIATTLDRLAILMGVKSNATDEPLHDLRTTLASFPHIESLEPQDLWSRIKPALEQALPPSLLQIDPSCAKKRVKQARGTWCAKYYTQSHQHTPLSII